MVTILTMSAKLATPGLLKIKKFRNKGYDVIIPDYEVINKVFSRDSNYTIVAVMWPKFGSSSISMREFNNLGLALGMTLKFYTSVSKGLRRFWELSPTFVEVTWKKLVGMGGGLFAHPE